MLIRIYFQMKEFFSRIGARQENGQGLIEYALIIVLIAVVVIVAIAALGPVVANVFTRISANLSSIP
jgi:pilus assembly protein Flp/PilA